MWSAPKAIVSGTDSFVNDADFHQLPPCPTEHWPRTGSATMSPARRPTTSTLFSRATKAPRGANPSFRIETEKKQQHGFLSLLPSTDGKLGAVWLDGRQYKDDDEEGDMALIYTTIASDGTLGKETILDPRACECCHTSAAATPDGMAVVYRDRSDKEIRDISIVRYANGNWSSPEPLSQDGWEI